MIKVFKILKGYENINATLFFQIVLRGDQTDTRGHTLKLLKARHLTVKIKYSNKDNGLMQIIRTFVTLNEI